MKTLLVAMCIVFVAIFVAGCVPSETERTAIRVDHLTTELIFVKYPGTDICFAIHGLGYAYSMMSTVPCEKVPVGKLIEGRLLEVK